MTGTLIGSCVAVFSANRQIVQRANEQEIVAIDRRLERFIGPFLHLSAENLIMVDGLRAGQLPGFRTLVALLDPAWLPSLSKGDRTLVEQIVQNGKDLRDLIRKEAAPFTHPLLPILAEASAHFTFLEKAHAGGLDNDPTRYAKHVYPRRLDVILEEERRRLEARRDALRGHPARRHPPAPVLELPDTESAGSKAGPSIPSGA